ncbi:MAG: hypothetical protein KAJ96_04185 [Candidatus Thorarchaeota archaeon]|nr:hypothetical protein [Candidatus Thorarchaeota archaeon]
MGVDLEKLRREVLELMNKGKSGHVGKKLMDVFRKIDPSEFHAFGEVMKEAILVDPAAFSEKAYILFDKMMRAKDPSKLSEYEKYFVQNFCKLPGEEFAVIADGWVETGKSSIKGNIFVSNYRIIATGVQEAKKARVSGGGMFAFLSLIQLGSYLYNKSIMDQITRSITDGSFTMVNYGVLYPIKGGYNIEQEAKGFRAKINDRVNFTVDVPYTNKKGQEEIADLHVSVVINIKNPEIATLLDKVEEIVRANAKVV